MTGPISFNRQHSSTAGLLPKSKLTRPKLRRSSSVDDHGSFESTIDEIFTKKSFGKCDPTSSDNDSGIEDFDQQQTTIAVEPINNSQDDEIDEFEAVCTSVHDQILDETLSQTTLQLHINSEHDQQFILYDDLELAALVGNDEKKEFCNDTSIVFHGEFARRISMPISLTYRGINYYLFHEEGINMEPYDMPGFAYVKLDNAKAQFKCQNPACRRLWTSMRARISFKISVPSECGFVFLKVYGQNCQICEAPAEPLWYMEEVCRVMGNLTESMFRVFFSAESQGQNSPLIEQIEYPTENARRSHHDPYQRKGKMRAPHDSNHCEACQRGFCFI